MMFLCDESFNFILTNVAICHEILYCAVEKFSLSVQLLEQRWNFAGLIFQANQALTVRLLRELALVQPIPN